MDQADGFGRTPLHWAAGYTGVEVVEVAYAFIHVVVSLAETVVDCQILLEHGAYIEETTNAGQTPLHFAAVSRNPEVLKVR